VLAQRNIRLDYGGLYVPGAALAEVAAYADFPIGIERIQGE